MVRSYSAPCLSYCFSFRIENEACYESKVRDLVAAFQLFIETSLPTDKIVCHFRSPCDAGFLG